jgi:DNA-binding GntR family transcriptional regulator
MGGCGGQEEREHSCAEGSDCLTAGVITAILAKNHHRQPDGEVESNGSDERGLAVDAGGTGLKTTADRAYEIICNRITSGELLPGSKLSRRKMATLTGASIIPVIEALHRLEDEGLVESYPYFGSRVIELTEQIINDRGALRAAVECEVARILAMHATEEQVNRLQFLARQLDETSRVTDEDLFWERHYEFHLSLASMTERPSLEKTLQRINLFLLLQRAVQTKKLTGVPIPDDLHMRIVRGIATKDADVSEKVMREHMRFSGIIRE